MWKGLHKSLNIEEVWEKLQHVMKGRETMVTSPLTSKCTPMGMMKCVTCIHLKMGTPSATYVVKSMECSSIKEHEYTM
jgi:hypothetical protein